MLLFLPFRELSFVVSRHSLLWEPSVLLCENSSLEKKYCSSFRAHMCRWVAFFRVSCTFLTFLGVTQVLISSSEICWVGRLIIGLGWMGTGCSRDAGWGGRGGGAGFASGTDSNWLSQISATSSTSDVLRSVSYTMLEVFAVVFSKSGTTLVNCLEIKEKKNNVTKFLSFTRLKIWFPNSLQV